MHIKVENTEIKELKSQSNLSIIIKHNLDCGNRENIRKRHCSIIQIY